MAWIELHDTLPDHDKVLSVSEALNMDKDMVVGKLVRLWTWALNHREDGIFRLRDASTIAEVMRFKGKAQKLVDALVMAHLLDITEDGYSIHDWDERVGMLLERREKKRSQNRYRVQKCRDKKAECNALQEHYTDQNVMQCNAATLTVPKPIPKDKPYTERESPPISPPVQENAFVPPSVSAVSKYVRERGFNINPESFISYYKARGWRVGDGVMQDWKAVVQRWDVIEKERRPKNEALNYSQRKYTEEDVSKMGILTFDEDEQ